jgi:hypothetical protein
MPSLAPTSGVDSDVGDSARKLNHDSQQKPSCNLCGTELDEGVPESEGLGDQLTSLVGTVPGPYVCPRCRPQAALVLELVLPVPAVVPDAPDLKR